MSVSVEIEVENEEKCCEKCGAKMGDAAPSKDALLAELKKLLAETGTNNQADRQIKIDELISQISELGD
jgi:hypothetical protein